MFEEKESWVGFDLDRTMARRVKGDDHKTIGEPIHRMIDLAKSYIASGKKVKIFTARVASDDAADVQMQVEMISAFSLKHFGKVLEITCIKDRFCIRIYDDIARQVIPNTGNLVE